ncbi:uncharacterized protein LOC132548047 [Ylistrum balloti]|uniref:uncharacterized protein LOC132548047 n=1 Tax=Ylistrum balloti TaxID=509963 RepID=UPI002905A9C3|nr:uncharacterized protein LOC132548047 [Ylistrum balloti]
MLVKTSLHLVVLAGLALSVVSSHIVKGKGNNDDQPGQSRHDGKRAMDNMYKGMMESFKTSFVPGSKKDDGNGNGGDASPSDWKNMIPGFAKGFIPDSAEDGTDNSTVSEDAVTDSSATNSTSMGIEGSFKVNAALKDDKSTADETMTSQDGESVDTTALPEVLSTDDNVPSEYGLLTGENDLANINTQSSETGAMETPTDLSGTNEEQDGDMTQLENDLAETTDEDLNPQGDTGTQLDDTETDLKEKEPDTDAKKSMFLKMAMSGKASLKHDEKPVTDVEEKKETTI